MTRTAQATVATQTRSKTESWLQEQARTTAKQGVPGGW